MRKITTEWECDLCETKVTVIDSIIAPYGWYQAQLHINSLRKLQVPRLIFVLTVTV